MTNPRTPRPRIIPLAILLLLCSSFPVFSVFAAPPAPADFMSLSESAVYNPATQQVLFTLQFNQPPDFVTTDALGRQANSFQFLIVGNPSLPRPTNFDSILRGEEIHLAPGMVRIRVPGSADPVSSHADPAPDPASAGWGAIRGTVPYTLSGDILSFSVPLNLISDRNKDGHFTYRLETYRFGRLTGSITHQSTIVPQPAP